MRELTYWLWLSKLNISPKARAAVLRDFGDAEQAFHAPEGSFRNRQGISSHEAEFLDDRSLQNAEDALRACDRQNIEIITWNSPLYPEKLRQTPTPPCCLFVRGTVLPLDELPVISVIGTRQASPYGVKMGERLAMEIAANGGTVLTLLGAGVGEAAARGALLSDRPCIAVLGTAHEACRDPLVKEILRSGMVISEYPPKTRSQRHFFRERNRVAAGLSDGVVVVEAPEKSGTRLLVNEAAEQGRDIFAVPGNADAENAAGTLSLLKEGARLVTDGSEVMAEYFCRYPGLCGTGRRPESLFRSEFGQDSSTTEQEPEKQTAAGQPEGQEQSENQSSMQLRDQLAELTDDQLKIISAIDPNSTHVDDITERTGLTAARVLAQLTVLEIRGFVKRETGRRFSLKFRIEK